MEAPGTGGPRAGETSLDVPHCVRCCEDRFSLRPSSRSSVSGAVPDTSVTAGSRTTHVGNGDRFQIYTVTATGAHRRHLTSGRTYSS